MEDPGVNTNSCNNDLQVLPFEENAVPHETLENTLEEGQPKCNVEATENEFSASLPIPASSCDDVHVSNTNNTENIVHSSPVLADAENVQSIKCSTEILSEHHVVETTETSQEKTVLNDIPLLPVLPVNESPNENVDAETSVKKEIEIDSSLAKKTKISDSHHVLHCELSSLMQIDEVNVSEVKSENMDTDQISSPQEYKIDNSVQITGSWKEFSKKEGISMRGCKWSPDGTCILTNSDDNVLRVFDLPRELHCQESWPQNKTLPELDPALRVKEGGLIYDYCWYPLMSSWNPLSCCLLSTSKDSPLHLWDAFSGELRCSYRAYNAVDEIEAAYSVAFNPTGEQVYCGFKNTIRVFNTTLPGRECEIRNLKQSSFMSRTQTGIISCICINPVMPKIYVAGSYNSSLGIYSEPAGSLLCLFLGHSRGITHLQFSQDGTKLFSGGRKDTEIICWDIRNPGNVLFTVHRDVTTNQRIYFDITPDNRYIVSGNTNGHVSVWDMLQIESHTAGQEPLLQPSFSFSAHTDCVNGVSIHQQYPILATASGQRHVSCELDTTSEDNRDTSLKLWWLGNVL